MTSLIDFSQILQGLRFDNPSEDITSLSDTGVSAEKLAEALVNFNKGFMSLGDMQKRVMEGLHKKRDVTFIVNCNVYPHTHLTITTSIIPEDTVGWFMLTSTNGYLNTLSGVPQQFEIWCLHPNILVVDRIRKTLQAEKTKYNNLYQEPHTEINFFTSGILDIKPMETF